MAVTKLSVSLDSEVADAVRAAAARAGTSLSTWLNDAARRAARRDAGLAAARDWWKDEVPATDVEVAAADATLDRLRVIDQAPPDE